MDRRTFLAGTGAVLLAAPLAAEAQQAGRVPRVGLLLPGSRSDPLIQPYLDVFQQGLRELGYVEGQSIAFEYRWAEGQYERLAAPLAGEAQQAGRMYRIGWLTPAAVLGEGFRAFREAASAGLR